jgi:uncharacterized protein YllA (UPF0747 family)
LSEREDFLREAIGCIVTEVCEDLVEKIERLHAGKTNFCVCGLLKV